MTGDTGCKVMRDRLSRGRQLCSPMDRAIPPPPPSVATEQGPNLVGQHLPPGSAVATMQGVEHSAQRTGGDRRRPEPCPPAQRMLARKHGPCAPESKARDVPSALPEPETSLLRYTWVYATDLERK